MRGIPWLPKTAPRFVHSRRPNNNRRIFADARSRRDRSVRADAL